MRFMVIKDPHCKNHYDLTVRLDPETKKKILYGIGVGFLTAGMAAVAGRLAYDRSKSNN